MLKINDAGEWAAIIKNEGKTPNLLVRGRFPTNGEKPVFKLEKTDPQGIVSNQLVLRLQFGGLVNAGGNTSATAYYNKALLTTDEYQTVLILDDSYPVRILAQINVVLEKNVTKINPRNGLDSIVKVSGTVILLTVPKEERDGRRRDTFLKFDSFSKINGNIPQNILDKEIFALVEYQSNGTPILIEAVPRSDMTGQDIPTGENENSFIVFGIISKHDDNYRFIGRNYRFMSLEENLRKLKKKRVTASGNFGDLHTEDGSFSAFVVEDYSIIKNYDGPTDEFLSGKNDSEDDGLLITKAIESGEIFIIKTFPPTLSIIACGMTATSGWSDFSLSQYHYLVPPADGIYEFDFFGLPPGPSSIVMDVLTPCFANYLWDDFPFQLKGVRIHTKSNSVEILLPD